MKKLFFTLLVCLFALALAPRAFAFTPPPMTAHVTDTAGELTQAQRLTLDKKLEDYRLRTTNEIAVFIPKSLEGDAIEDVGIATGRAWKLGVKGKDNGVLLIIAPVERKARIEVGRGVEGSLPDLKANDIIRQNIRPYLLHGHENYDAAVESATDAIIASLDAGAAGAAAGRAASRPHPTTAGDVLFAIVFFLFMFAVPIFLVIAFIRRGASAFTSNGRGAGGGWASGSSWSSDSSGGGGSWSSGGDSGFSGGGGDFGGGGSSDSF